jgi:hypothetical protein
MMCGVNYFIVSSASFDTWTVPLAVAAIILLLLFDKLSNEFWSSSLRKHHVHRNDKLLLLTKQHTK